MKLKTLLSGISLFAGLVASAHAAQNWAGLYGGVQVGYAMGATQARDDGVPSSDIDYDGWLGGVTLGYNHPVGNYILGVEGDYALGSASGSGDGGSSWGCGSNDKCSFVVKELGTLRLRVGYDMGNVLPYLTAGLAFGKTQGQADHSCPDWCGEDTQTGWTAGAGAEFVINPKWSAKLEYLYVDLDRGSFSVGDGGSGFEADFKFHTARVGVNYRF